MPDDTKNKNPRKKPVAGEDESAFAAEDMTASWEKAEGIIFADEGKSSLRSRRVRAPSVEEEASTPDNSAAELAKLDGELEEQLERNESIGIVLGESGNGWIEVEIAEENKQAYLQALDFAADATIDKETVLKSLTEDYDLKFGIDQEAVAALVERAATGEVIRENVLIAQEEPPVPGEAGRIEYLFLEGWEEGQDGKQEKHQERPPPPFWELYTGFEKHALDDVLTTCPLARMVCPGEKLAVEIPPTEGTPGTDVLGQPHTIPGQPASLAVGENIAVSDEGYFSQIYGYVCLIRDKFTVVSPLWISADKTEAFFIHLPLFGPDRLPEPDWIQQLLEIAGIEHGIDEGCVEKLCQHAVDKRPFADLIACGTAAIDGTDTRIDYTFDPEKRPGAFLPDGSIDLKQRNVVIGVEEDQLLGKLQAAIQGQNGIDVKGQEIPARNGEKKTFKCGRNVRLEEEGDGSRCFYADISGSVKIEGETITVEPIQHIDGSVDYEIGNLDVPIDLYIKGSVLSGFKVKCGGNVIIEGIVENGGEVRAHGDVTIAQGIVGGKAKVIIQGYLETKLIQNSMVIVNGDIHIGDYIYNGSVRSGGKIIVNSANEKLGGSIVSGQVHATHGIEAKRLGSSSTDRTLVGVRESPQMEFRMRQHQENLEKCNAAVLRILRTLGLQEVNAELLRRCIRKAPPEKRKKVAELIKFLQETVQKKQEFQETQRVLREQIASELEQSTIKISAEIFPDVMIQMGEDIQNIPEKLPPQLIFRDEEGISWKPL